MEIGYLHHGKGTNGPFRTESVSVKQDVWPNADKWLAFYEGKWRRVHVKVSYTYIVCYGAKIVIQIDGDEWELDEEEDEEE